VSIAIRQYVDALAKLKFEVSKANDAESIAYIIGYYGRATGDVIEREQENRRREAVLAIVNSDPQVIAVTGPSHDNCLQRGRTEGLWWRILLTLCRLQR